MDKRKQSLKESNIKETSHKDGASSVSVGENTVGKAREFFKSQIQNTPEKPSTLKSDAIDKEAMENAVRENLLSTYPPEEKMTPVLKSEKTGENKIVTRDQLYKQKKENVLTKIWSFIKRNRRKAMVTGVATGISMAAMAGTKSPIGDPADSLRKADIKKMEAVISKTSERIEIKISNYFQTDKAEISKENALEISKLIDTYVKSLNMDNVDQFINSTPILNVSCDPRPTSSFEDGNNGLALARANETQRVINELDISNANLTPEKIKQVKETFANLKFNIPPGGVIDYHAVATDAEWEEAKTNEAKRMEIYRKMRFVNLELVAVNKEKPAVKIETDWSTFKTEGFKRAYVFFDKSPSMEQNKEELKNYILTATEQEIPMRVVGFTDVADTVLDAKNLKEGVENIKKMKAVNKTKELGIDVIIKEMQNKKDNDKTIALYASDEEFQDLTKSKLEEMTKIANEKNVEFVFYVKINGVKYILSLGDLINSFDQEWETRGRNIDIQNTKQGIINFQNELERTTDKKEKKRIKEMITVFENRLKNFEKINVENFTKLKKIGRDLTNAPSATSYSSGIDITKNK